MKEPLCMIAAGLILGTATLIAGGLAGSVGTLFDKTTLAEVWLIVLWCWLGLLCLIGIMAVFFGVIWCGGWLMEKAGLVDPDDRCI